jgi:eukaryotic-like serine/threonine-protein kinase
MAPTADEGRGWVPGRTGGWVPWALAVAVLLAAILILVLVLGGDGEDTSVPSVVGLDEQAASDTIVDSGLATQVAREESDEPVGTVIGQNPDPGAELESGGVVALTVSGNPEQAALEDAPTGPVEVPDLVGRQYVLAGEALDGAGLVTDSRMVEGGQRWGVVLAQRPAAGTELEAGEHVELDVALPAGDDQLDIPVPDLEDQAAAQALAEARALGFTTRTTEREATSGELVGTVVDQSPAPGETVPELSLLRLVVGR